MYCAACGAEIPRNSRFCKKCGAAQTARRVRTTTPSGTKRAETVGHSSGRAEQNDSKRFLWIGVGVIPLIVICAIVTMIGAMRPSEKKVVQFTSPRLIAFSGTGPSSAEVGKPIRFTYEVANAGTADFEDFRLAFPESIDSTFDVSEIRPDAKVSNEGGKKMLAFGVLTTGQKTTYSLTLIPKTEGELEVKATFYDGNTPLANERSEGMVYKKVKVSP